MWNYRVLSYPSKDPLNAREFGQDRHGEGYFGLVEAVYNEAGGLCAHDEVPIITGNSPDEILESLNIMLGDVKRHCQDSSIVLNVDKIVYESFTSDGDDMEKLTEFKFDHDE